MYNYRTILVEFGQVMSRKDLVESAEHPIKEQLVLVDQRRQLIENTLTTPAVEGPLYLNGQFRGACVHGQIFLNEGDWHQYCEIINQSIQARQAEESETTLSNYELSQQVIAQLERERLERKASDSARAKTKQPYRLVLNLTPAKANRLRDVYQQWRAKKPLKGSDETLEATTPVIFAGINELEEFANLLAENEIDLVLCDLPNLFMASFQGRVFNNRDLYSNIAGLSAPEYRGTLFSAPLNDANELFSNEANLTLVF